MDGSIPLFLHACELQSFELLKLLADAVADVNHPNALGYHPLDIAYWQGEFPMGCYTAESERWVSYLSRNGVSPLARSKPKTKAL
ncbi:MAG: hypothetical protein ACRCWP_08760 [Shewanella sp.]